MNAIRSEIIRGERRERRSLLGSKRRKGTNSETGLQSVAIPRTEARTKDTRESPRHRLAAETVTITHQSGTRDVQLVNLSGGGAMIEGEDFAPMLWERVDLHLGDSDTVECVVRWRKGSRVGLEFAHETRIDCPPEVRAAVLREVLARNFPEAAIAVPAPEQKGAPAVAPDESELRRSEPRHPLIWNGEIHYAHSSTPVRLRNISKFGALIECEMSLPDGAEPLLDLGEAGSLFATVTWSRGDQAGLKFSEAFDLANLARARPEVAPARWEQPAYLRNKEEAGSPWDPRWNRLSLGELSQELDGFLKR